uniref:ORF8 n=1 Tax=Human cytomegalovirus TaxID=10359 RepID=Q6RXD9_HCMV|nr:ORF8 [Human betaherpesvirus 5]
MMKTSRTLDPAATRTRLGDMDIKKRHADRGSGAHTFFFIKGLSVLPPATLRVSNSTLDTRGRKHTHKKNNIHTEKHPRVSHSRLANRTRDLKVYGLKGQGGGGLFCPGGGWTL